MAYLQCGGVAWSREWQVSLQASYLQTGSRIASQNRQTLLLCWVHVRALGAGLYAESGLQWQCSFAAVALGVAVCNFRCLAVKRVRV